MRVLPSNRSDWLRLLLFPFKAYLVLGLACLFVWEVATSGHRPRGARVEAAFPVVLGYLLCIVVFGFVALIQFSVRRRSSALTSGLFALAAFLIYHFLLPWCASA